MNSTSTLDFVRQAAAWLAWLLASLCAGPAFADDPAPPPSSAASAASPSIGIAPYRPRFGRARPVVAIVGHNASTELIDFVVPYSVLARSGAADVIALGLEPGALKMRPALVIEPQATVEQFDERVPQGADYVIVPAVAGDKTGDPRLLQWLQAQAERGAIVVSICDGAIVVAKAGLFKGHRATGHWATQSMREEHFPDTRWLKNVRYVDDGPVVSSAGVSAALPLSLALVEAIGGRARAGELARELGVASWGPEHDSERFHLSLGDYLTAARNRLLTTRDELELPIAEGVDELALAMTADAFGRTWRSPPYTSATTLAPLRTRGGLLVHPDRASEAEPPAHRRTVHLPDSSPAQALDAALAEIDRAYGRATGTFVSAQLEYAR